MADSASNIFSELRTAIVSDDDDHAGDSSGLSEAPSDIDESNFDDTSQSRQRLFQRRQPSTHRRRKRSFCSFDADSSPIENEIKSSRPTKIARITPDNRVLAPLENVPTEILQTIAACSSCDTDLKNLQLVSRKVAFNVTPDDSSVWKVRFLAKYDYPIVQGPLDFSVAYKLRRLVLSGGNFVPFGNGKDRRLEIQLEALRDMVLETFNKSELWLPTPKSSKNLACFSSPGTSPWIVTFLSSPFYNHNQQEYGQAHDLFDALQLTLSYLLLSLKSPATHQVHISTYHYDMVRVYNWNQPFNLLFTRLPDSQQEQVGEPRPFKSATFPNLRSPSPKPWLKRIKYHLDTHSLLHIRNFWHKHLIGKDNSFYTALGVRDNTYASMASSLHRLGHTPKAWTAALQDPDDNLEHILSGKWYGHYSGLHPWPKKKSDLQERQTNAEDWTDVSPLKLDFKVTPGNTDSAWPLLFSTIPAFEATTPDPAVSDRKTFYLRGIAPWIDTAAELERRSATSNLDSLPPTRKPSNTPNTAQPEYHPYLSLRLRGIIHPIAPQSSIAGWHRIIMVLFKPQAHYLIKVLEHAEEDYGSSFSVSVSAQLDQTTVQAILSGQSQIDPAEAGKHLNAYLRRKLEEGKGPEGVADGDVLGRGYGAEQMTRERIQELEEGFLGGEHLGWEDMEYAYAYEGVVLPGGAVMMGRWWRVGELGLGEGKEVDVEGLSVLAGGEEVNGDGNVGDVGVDGLDGVQRRRRRKRMTRGLERGVFCFWA